MNKTIRNISYNNLNNRDGLRKSKVFTSNRHDLPDPDRKPPSLTQYVSTMTCLVRSDFNYAFIFFCYFAWQQRKDRIAINLMISCVLIMLIYDLIWGALEARVWTRIDPDNSVWNRLSGLHMFGIVCSAIGFILKLVLLFYLCYARKIEQRVTI